MTRAAVVLLALASLAGCATAPAERWLFEKPGATEAERKRDQQECFTQAVDAVTTRPGLMMKMDRAAYRACMEQRGYTLSAEKN